MLNTESAPVIHGKDDHQPPLTRSDMLVLSVRRNQYYLGQMKRSMFVELEFEFH